jgi:hypothetical protein
MECDPRTRIIEAMAKLGADLPVCPVLHAYAEALSFDPQMSLAGTLDPGVGQARLRLIVLETARKVVPLAAPHLPAFAALRELPDDAGYQQIKLTALAARDAASAAARASASAADAAACAADAAACAAYSAAGYAAAHAGYSAAAASASARASASAAAHAGTYAQAIAKQILSAAAALGQGPRLRVVDDYLHNP